MKIRKAFKFRLKPTAEHRQKLAQTAGCVRLVWNKGLAETKNTLERKEKYSGYSGLCDKVKVWKSEENTQFLKRVHSQPLQQTLKDLDRALKDGFKKDKGFPKFKRKGRDKSFRYPQGVKVRGNLVFLPKVGWCKFQKSRDIEGTIKNTTVSFCAGHWYVAFQTEFECEVAPRPIQPEIVVGIDLGIAKFATLSTGEVVEPRSSFRKLEKKLAKAQRSLARKKKGSNSWLKQKYKVQKVHKKAANARNDFLHKLSSNISKNHAVVVLEDLRVINMSKSAKGSIEEPGKNVKAKSGLNKSILDQGWYEFRRMLEYKQGWSGGELITIAPHYTSQRCNVCGHTSKENRLTQSRFACVRCGHSENADLNAANNIKAAGTTVLAGGDISLATG
jgi:putative transposase